MAKKKKEICPYCGKGFAYLSRHKCKVKERIEGISDEKSDTERRIERIEETKKTLRRNLKKDERSILNIINERKDVYFDELLEVSDGKSRNELEDLLEVLVLQSKIKLKRELVNAAWTKHIYAIETYDELDVDAVSIDKERKDFVWDLFSRQPCFICPVNEKCNETNLDAYNPQHCPWLTDWIDCIISKQEYNINFDQIKGELGDF